MGNPGDLGAFLGSGAIPWGLPQLLQMLLPGLARGEGRGGGRGPEGLFTDQCRNSAVTSWRRQPAPEIQINPAAFVSCKAQGLTICFFL
jgi:hypothetical protein